MKKEYIFFIIFLSILFLDLKFSCASLGLSPASKVFYFTPNSSYFVDYVVLYAEPDQKLILSAEGDLKEYVRFDKKNLTGPEAFRVYIDLPNDINKYGENLLRIIVSEYKDPASGISTVLSVGARIYIYVAYPGKYLEIKNFSVTDANENESFSFILSFKNLGSEALEPSAYFEVYSDEKLLDRYNVGRKLVEPNTEDTFEKTVDINKYKAGNYQTFAYLIVNDGNNTVLKANTTLRIGSLFVEIKNWTREVVKGKINPFFIEIESKWNNDIKNIYAEVNVSYENGTKADYFKTSPIELKRWENGVLNGFLNAENLEEGNYNIYITLFYENSNSSKSGNVKIIIPETPKKEFKIPVLYIVIGLITLIGVIIIIFIIFFMKNREFKPNVRENRHKK
ncbi:MAG: hypothetical protein QXW97_01765 [Candidatus Pacearchaeota archaeon]